MRQMRTFRPTATSMGLGLLGSRLALGIAPAASLDVCPRGFNGPHNRQVPRAPAVLTNIDVAVENAPVVKTVWPDGCDGSKIASTGQNFICRSVL